MRFELFEIVSNRNYSIVIGTRNKPDSQFRDHIREQIREAMESLDRSPDSYSVSVIRNEEEEPRDTVLPEFRIGKKYLLFVILSSGDSAESFTDRELAEYKEEIGRGIFVPPDSRIALVLLRDASIGVMESEKRTESIKWIGLDYDRGYRRNSF